MLYSNRHFIILKRQLIFPMYAIVLLGIVRIPLSENLSNNIFNSIMYLSKFSSPSIREYELERHLEI